MGANMVPTACPDPEVLAAFDRGELSAETAESLAAHVQSCTTCQGLLRKLVESADPLLSLLRQVKQDDAARGAPTIPTGPPGTDSFPVPPGYELLEEVGRGGMGVVYRGRDVRLNREVAIKFLRADCPADSAARVRFVTEAQITGQLQHPGIPPVHELGTLLDGRPFLAMKLVKGRTLHELLKESRRSGQDWGQFLAIFEQICQAVGFAHAHRVLHRDLKPANVMVGAFGEVQVMDWGLAKVLVEEASPASSAEGDLPETITAVTAIETPLASDSATRTGAVMGTPAFMAPEQAGGEIRKLDARSDVFGLGAILCQILTGLPPYQGKDVHAIRLQAVRGELQDAFARLDACGAESDLVALCKRCLAFQQEDRPKDGLAVARGVARIRQAADERARQAEMERAAALGREAEQHKRRRQLLMAAGLLAAVLVAGILGTTIGLFQARQATDAERQANIQAQKRLKQVENANEVLTSIFKDVDFRKIKQGNEPLEAVLARRLVTAAEQLEGEAVGDPLMVAALQDRLGTSLINLGHAKEAIPLFEKAQATRSMELGADHLDTLLSRNNLAESYEAEGHLDKALPLYEETLLRLRAKLGMDDPHVLLAMNNLASGYYADGQLDKALRLFEETLRLRQARLGADHPDTLLTMNNLAEVYEAEGRLDKALPLYEETLRLLRARLKPDHPHVLTSMNNLASGYYANGQLDKALPLFEETLQLRKARLGIDDPDTLTSMNNLAEGYHMADQLDKALPLLEETLRRRQAKLGADHPDTLLTLNNLANAFCDAKQGEKAVPLFAEYFERQRKKAKPNDPGFAGQLAVASLKLLACNRFQEAEPYLRECLAIRAKTQPDAWTTFNTQSMLGGVLLAQKKYADAEPLLRQGYEGMKQRETKIPQGGQVRLTEAVARLVALYEGWGKKGEAAKWKEELAQLQATASSPKK
jgi:hypothetical protein